MSKNNVFINNVAAHVFIFKTVMESNHHFTSEFTNQLYAYCRTISISTLQLLTNWEIFPAVHMCICKDTFQHSPL